MCLVLQIAVPAASRIELEAAAKALPPTALKVEVERPSRWRWNAGRPVTAWVSDDGPCACCLLSENADWNAPVWLMRPEILEPLARTLDAMLLPVRTEVTFTALWMGDLPLHEQWISMDKLVKLSSASQLGTRTRYQVYR